MGENLKNFLKNIVIFADLTDDELNDLIGLFIEINLKNGETLFKEGDEGKALYVISNGEIQVSKNIKGIQDKVLAVLGPGSIVGEMALLETQKRSATAIALQNSKVLEITRSDFNSLIEINPTAGFKIMLSIARLLSNRLRKMDEEFIKIFSQPFKAIVELQQILENIRKNYVAFGFEEGK
jgi:CRP/FNR family transcriptional regulator